MWQFVSKYISTIGVDFGVKPVQIGGKEVRVCFWDLAGHDDYLQIRNEFYSDAQGGILVFDVNNRSTFEALQSWVDEARQHGAKDPSVVLCGNKVDLGGRKRDVSADEAAAWAKSKGFAYVETSANSGDNVSSTFDDLFTQVATKAGLV